MVNKTPSLEKKVGALTTQLNEHVGELVFIAHRGQKSKNVRFAGCVGGGITDSLDSTYALGVIGKQVKRSEGTITLPMKKHVLGTYENERLLARGMQPWKAYRGSMTIPVHTLAALGKWVPTDVLDSGDDAYRPYNRSSNSMWHLYFHQSDGWRPYCQRRFDILVGNESVERFFTMPALENLRFDFLVDSPDKPSKAWFKENHEDKGVFGEALTLLGLPKTEQQEEAYRRRLERREERDQHSYG